MASWKPPPPPVCADMAGERLIYGTALALCGLMYLVWGEWLLWVLLAAVLGLPWVSLGLSIRSIAAFRAVPSGPKHLVQGQHGELSLLGCCTRPVPPFRGRLVLQQGFTGQRSRYRPEKGIPTEHCGCLRVRVEKARVCDYLGIFAFPVRNRGETLVIVRPRSIPGPSPGEALAPAPLGGIRSQDDEALRPYCPGDSLKSVHWKLSAKSGTLIFRQPVTPQVELPKLQTVLSGSPGELDRKLGRLLWLGEAHLREDRAFSLEAVTGAGTLTFGIRSPQELYDALDQLLCAPLAEGGQDGDG